MPTTTTASDQDRAAEARHGGRFLTMKLAQARTIRLDAHDPARERERIDYIRDGLAGRLPADEVQSVWRAWIDGDLGGERASVQVGRLRARGRDMARREYLDEALGWPIIRIALGLPVAVR